MNALYKSAGYVDISANVSLNQVPRWQMHVSNNFMLYYRQTPSCPPVKSIQC